MTDTVRERWQRPIPPPGTLPAEVDVAIIGGGIVGVSTAWFLARAGVRVALCEKGHIAGEQSGRNWGWVRKQGRDLRELPMMIDSMRIWEGLAQEIGEDVGFVRRGCLFAARTQKQLAGFSRWLESAKPFGIDSRLVSAREIGSLVQGASIDWVGGLYTASDGRAEPHLATHALARAATSAGARILTGCAVRGLDVEGGRTAGVITEHGRIRATKVVCAAGTWTRMFCRSLKIPLPQLTVRGTVVRTGPGPALLEGNLYDDRIGIRQRDDGGYTIAHGAVLDHPLTPASFRWFFKFLPAVMQQHDVVKLSLSRQFFEELIGKDGWGMNEASPFEKTRVLDPEPNEATLALIRKDLTRLFPALGQIPFVETWAGMIESTPDIVPVFDEIERIPGFFVASGLSGHGFGIGPGAGKAIAGMVMNTATGIDLQPLRYSRFFDGSPMQLPASI